MNLITLIKDDKQYYEYCKELERLECGDETTEEIEDTIEHLSILIEAWDNKHNTIPDLNPVEYLKLLMKKHGLNATGLQKKVGLDKTTISHLLNYRRGFSKHTIKVLAEHFAVAQETFNRSYELKNAPSKKKIINKGVLKRSNLNQSKKGSKTTSNV